MPLISVVREVRTASEETDIESEAALAWMKQKFSIVFIHMSAFQHIMPRLSHRCQPSETHHAFSHRLFFASHQNWHPGLPLLGSGLALSRTLLKHKHKTLQGNRLP